MNPGPCQSVVAALLPAALARLQEMVAINSWTHNRAGVARLAMLTGQHFAELGFHAESVPAADPRWGNHLVLTRPGRGARSIALVSHLDTVYPPEEELRHDFRWREEGDRLYGPGTNDIKGGTVMIWLVLSALQRVDPELFSDITWRILLNSAEEEYSPDFREVCRARMGPGCLAALVFEAEGRLGSQVLLVNARKGRATWRVTVRGRGAHAGSAHASGANAIVQLGRTVESLAALTNPAQGVTVNVGTIRGGTVLNRVPHEAVAEGELRAFDPAAFAAAKAAVLGLNGPGQVASLVDRHPCMIKAEILSETRPWPHNPGTEALLAHWAAAAQESGLSVDGHERGGLSDGNLLWDLVPTLDGLGPWGDHSHCSERSSDGAKDQEYVARSSFVPKAVLNLVAIRRLLAGSAGHVSVDNVVG